MPSAHDILAGTAFQVVLVHPDGYAHAAAFSELLETVVHGLRRLGAQVTQDVNRLVLPGPRAIVFGANLLSPAEADLLPPGTIVYNLEQISETSTWCSPAYLKLLARCSIWDYSARNIASLRRLGAQGDITHVPVGYVPELTRIPSAPTQDIDVLFYGSMNERRAKVVGDLRNAGLNARAVFGVYGRDRDELIAHSKVVLNVHYYETNIFELVRVSYLLANKKAVVAERHHTTEVEAGLEGAVRFARYGNLVAACAELVHDDVAREAIAQAGFERMAARDETTYLAAALAHR